VSAPHATDAAAISHRPSPIVLLSQSLDLGGSERQLAELAISLDRRRFEPTVVCFNSRGIRADELRRAGVPVVEFPVRSFVRPGAIALASRFYAWLRRHRVAIVHAFDVPTVAFAVPVARAARVPVVLASQRGDRRLFTRAAQRGLHLTDRLADGVVVNSDYVRRVLVAEFGVRNDAIHTCPNGLDLSVFYPTERSETEPADPKSPTAGLVVGFVAALRPEKSVETLIEAFSRLGDRTHRLVIVGDGPCKSALQTQARDLGLEGRCRFVDATTDVATWYRSFDVFVLPSLNESFSNSLMEAMACGCAVLASNVGGNPELVSDGANGLLFEPGNVGDLALRLETVLRNGDVRRRLATAAVRTIRERYTREASADRFAALYESLLTESVS
jgi:glycosyltransferase involved in cell wall biosynthesis